MVDLNVAVLTTSGQNLGAYAYTLQKARPIADISTGTWTPSSGSDLYAMLDEETPSDSDYIRSGDDPNEDTCEVKLGGLVDPNIPCGHTLYYRIGRSGSVQESLLFQLMEGSTELDSWMEFPPTGTVLGEHLLSPDVIGNISDYADLRVRITATAGSYYFVSKDGDDDGAGTYEDPWRTINYACTQLVAGDTLYIRGGTYVEDIDITVSGIAAERITISGYPGETVIIDGEYTIPTIAYNYLVRITGNYITIRDIIMTRSYWALLGLGGDYDYAINITGIGSYDCGIELYGNYDLMDNCSMTDNGKGYVIEGRPTWGSALGTQGDHCTIQNCLSYDNQGEGIGVHMGATNAIVQDCIVYDSKALNIYIQHANDVLIQRNLSFYNTDPTLTHGRIGIGISSETGEPYNVTIINNLVAYCGLNLDVGSSITTMTNYVIANNTFINTQKTQADIDSGYNMSIYFRLTLVNFSGSVFENNIVREDDSRLVLINTNMTNPHEGLTFDNNCWSKAVTAAAQGAHDIVDDPEISETDSWDNPLWYKILDTSPCRGVGLAIDEVTDDYWETPRSDPPDIGAHEYT